ncbi:hypothetical protein D1007_07136 [Hordeum vulgare]|nr:hypothetical protein D1007_07136 [Hordeum vulgare]
MCSGAILDIRREKLKKTIRFSDIKPEKRNRMADVEGEKRGFWHRLQLTLHTMARTCNEHPLTEYEKVKARNMMRNNRIFQSLGIDAIASKIRKTNGVQEGTTNGVQEGSGVISDDPEYNPKEDEVVVHKTVKALKTASKKRKSSEASAAMPPGRVMAPPLGQTKRILESDEPDRVTRQKATMAAATDHQESPLGMEFEISVEMRDEFL